MPTPGPSRKRGFHLPSPAEGDRGRGSAGRWGGAPSPNPPLAGGGPVFGCSGVGQCDRVSARTEKRNGDPAQDRLRMQRGRMEGPAGFGRLLPHLRPPRLVRVDLQPHHAERAGRRGVPDQPLRAAVVEVTASNLVKIDSEGNKLDGSQHWVNLAGFTQHSVFHKELSWAHAIVHTHTPDTMAVCCDRGRPDPDQFLFLLLRRARSAITISRGSRSIPRKASGWSATSAITAC